MMKTIGLLGGMSWESTLEYYKALNKGVKEALGGLHSAKILLHSVDFGTIEPLMRQGDWHTIGEILIAAARGLKNGGADFLLICTNTMHKLAPIIEKEAGIQLLHIADATAEVLLANNVSKVALLGTSFTMEQEFYRERLTDRFGLQVMVPAEKDRRVINDTIFSELCLGKLTAAAKENFLGIMNNLQAQGAEAVILGCTEIGMLVKQEDVKIRLFDTMAIHAAKAVETALAD